MGSDLILVTGASGYVALILVFWRAETKKMGLGRRWRLGSMIASHRSEIASRLHRRIAPDKRASGD
jgi:hypothetical protein